MVKKVYGSFRTLFINDGIVDSMPYGLLWGYGEIPQGRDYTFANFDEFYQNIVGWDNVWRGMTLLGRKRIVKAGAIKSITKKNFKSGSLNRSYEEIDTSFYSIQELMKRLSAEDFIQYCKDNGLTVCPIGQK